MGGDKVPAGALAPWNVGELPEPPRAGWRLWIALLGPGLVLAGTAIGSGEWLFGPAVSAQYGASLLWLATISILLQVFANLMFMRYAVYCGESIIVGGLRTWPGPRLWVPFYLVLDIAAIWPYNASNAAVVLAAFFLGRLPGPEDAALRLWLSVAVFLLAFVPLIFGGTVYRMLERVMTVKLVYVLGYLSLVAVFLVSPAVWGEVAVGFVQFGQVPQRAGTIVDGRHFSLEERDGGTTYRLRGTVADGEPAFLEFKATHPTEPDSETEQKERAARDALRREAMLRRATALAVPGRFFVEASADGTALSASGTVGEDGRWHATGLRVVEGKKETSWKEVGEVPAPYADRFRELLAHRGLEHVGLISYTAEHGRLPPLDWVVIVAFTAIAGLGGLTNTIFSNYARDKGWGMGKLVGAIPSAVGGRKITLSHVGRVFEPSEGSRALWRGWMRHIRRDQVIWTVANFIGMALPCMLALEFLRNTPVDSYRIAAMSAEGMADRYPDYATLFWLLTLLCGFMVLAPGQVSVGDQIARRWTDIIWTGTRWAGRLSGTQVKVVYYGIMGIYAVLGLTTMSLLDPFHIAKIGAILQNVALGFSALHAWYANRTLLPRELHPSWLLQAGVFCCGVFFLGISVIVLLYL